MTLLRCAFLLMAPLAIAGAQTRTAEVRVNFAEKRGPLEMDRFSLGQGGLSEEPMWTSRVAEIRALKPRLIRLFLQEYFDVLPGAGRYDWSKLDESVDLILRTGAKPLMCIAFKPNLLFPKVDQDVVEPSNYEDWEELIYNLVRHYRERGAGIRYWEVSNEPDIGEDGGCPYRFKPESYVRYYQHTAAAIRRADPTARVGGPALANPDSPILPALLEFCAAGKAPIDFVSWHIYSSDPLRIRATIDRKQELLRKYPSLRVETFLDEWNMSLSRPVTDPRFQPCFIAEVAWQMKEGGLDYSCYYHIRDYHVSGRFARFMSPHGAAVMTRWWDRTPQYDGLFDFQDRVRPAYFLFRLLAQLTGERLGIDSPDRLVHGFASYDGYFGTWQLLLWNFSKEPVRLRWRLEGMPGDLTARQLTLDAAAPGDDENIRLRPEAPVRWQAGQEPPPAELDAYGVSFWGLEKSK